MEETKITDTHSDLPKKKVKWKLGSQIIAQVPERGLEYSILSAKDEQIIQFVWCKDFIQDIYWSFLNNKEISIHGFQYNPKIDPAPCTSKIKLMLANFDDELFKDRIVKNVLPFIHEIEEEMGIPKTILYECSNVPLKYKKCGVFILVGSKRWCGSPPMISLYTLLSRVGFVHNPNESFKKTLVKMSTKEFEPYYDNRKRDGNMFKGISSLVDLIIMKNGDKKLFKGNMVDNFCSKKDLSIDVFHKNCGLVGLQDKKTNEFFPHWFS